MELLQILIATVVVLGLFWGIRLVVEHLIADPSILRLSHHRRNTFMKTWRSKIIEKLLQFDSHNMNTTITQAFPDADISQGANADWTIIRAKYKGVPFTIHHKANGYFWLQLPPLFSFSTSASFDQQRKISMRIADDFAPIKINFSREDGVTNSYLIGLYLTAMDSWDEDEFGFSICLKFENEDSIDEFSKELSKYIPEESIDIEKVTNEENLFIIFIPKEYKLGLIKAENSYLTSLSTPIDFELDIPNQPFSSQEGLIISPSFDIVKAWIDLYLFMKDELK